MFIIVSPRPGLLGQRERPRVQRVGELLVVLGDDAGAAARRAVELDELEVQQRRDCSIEPCSSGVKPRLTQPGQ